MLDRVYEWYRMVDPDPSSETLEKRKASVMDFVGRLTAEEDKDYKLLIACTAAVVNGFETGFSQDSPLVEAVVKAIRDHQPAFPKDLSENALELRACCAISLGELLARSQQEGQRRHALLVSSLLRSAVPIRPSTREKHLRRVLEELCVAASSVEEQAAITRRQRRPVSLEALEKITAPADVPTFWKSLLPAMRACFAALQDQAAADREELEVLWWLYAGFSTAARQPLPRLDPGVAALCCGGELANLVLIPPLESTREMVRRETERGKKTPALLVKSLEQFSLQWEDPILALLAPDDGPAQQLVRGYPALLPLSWQCVRLRESNRSTGWIEEFQRKTSISPKQARGPADWAVQAFNERVSQRIYAEFTQD